MIPFPLAPALQQAMTAVLIIAYLAYEIHWGRVAEIMDKQEGLISVIIAVAEENPEIDEENVAERFDGDRPAQYKNEPEDEVTTRGPD